VARLRKGARLLSATPLPANLRADEDANHDNVYDLVVSATDVFGATSTQAISINVTNLAEAGRTINGGNRDDVLSGTPGNDVINGGNGDDDLAGGDGNDSISGGNGNDALVGWRGSDMLNGGNGNDVLSAGAGNDVLTGGNGNDILRGGSGDDYLAGGNGNNIFAFAGGFGHDTISDFGHGDRIEFDGGVFQNFGAVQAASHQVGNDTVITLDAGNSIVLQHVSMSSLHASNFLFA
jgi:Ca2+-binding RTX toxin-like protein